jgi:CelD/BcsL family acetyltransferase involved in cellulose biosynthesis
MKILNINNNFQIYTYDCFDLELENLWKNFETKSFYCIFHKFEWVKNWYQICCKDNANVKILIIVIYKDKKISAILPFTLNYFLGLKVLKWTGYPFSDLNSGLLEKNFFISQNEFKIIWSCIIKSNNIDVVDLINCPQKIIEINNPLLSQFKFKSNLISYKVINNNRNFENYCLIKKINNKNSFLQDKRRLEKKGKLLFKSLDNINDIERNEVIQFLLKHKEEQLLRTSAWNYLSKVYYVNFLKKIFTLNFSRFYVLYLDDIILSVVMGYEDPENKIFYHIIPTYNTEYKKFSVGIINLYYLLKFLIEKNFSLDFTIGKEDYKVSWSTEKHDIYYFCKSYSFKGVIYIFYKMLYFIFSNQLFKKFFFKKIYHYFKI